MAAGFAFSLFRFSSLSALLRELLLLFASVFPAYLSFCFAGLCIITCSSPFSSLLSARSLSLRSFDYLPCGSFAWVEFFLLVFSPFPTFIFGSFTSEMQYYSLTGVCALCIWLLLPLFSVIDFLFSFLFIGLASAVSSLALFILAPCSALLPVSLSFSFFLFAGLSSSLPVLSASLSFFLRWIPAEFSRCCSLISFPVRSLGHRLFVFLPLCLFLFCVFGSFPCDFPASSLVPLGTSQSSSGSTAFLRSLLGLPVLSLASLQSWTSLLRVLYSVSGLLMGSPFFRCSCQHRRYADAFCPFCLCLSLLLLLVTSVVGRLLSSSLMPSLYLPLFWGVPPFALCLCLAGICSLVSEWACFLLWGLECLFIAHRPCPWCLHT